MILGRNRAFAGIISQDEVILDWVALNPVAAVIIGIRRVDTQGRRPCDSEAEMRCADPSQGTPGIAGITRS